MHIGISLFDLLPGQSGGTQVYTRELIRALAHVDSQNQYTLLVRPENINLFAKDAESSFNVALCQLPAPLPFPLRTARWVGRRMLQRPPFAQMVASQIEKVGLDLVHYPATTIYPLTLNVPCVLTFWDMQHEFYPQFFPQKVLHERARTFRPSAKKAIRVIAPSRHTRQTLQEKYKLSAERITVIPPAAGSIFRSPIDSGEIVKVKSKYHLPDRFLFYPANPWPHKNHISLLKALKILKNEFRTTCPLVLTGALQGQHNVNLEQELRKYPEIADFVIQLGYVPVSDLPALYAAAELLVFPSLFEGFGLPILEAMACACPVVCSGMTSLPELVGEAALLFDPCDPRDIAQAIHRVLSNATFRQTLIDKGLERVKAFSWEETAIRIVQVYQEVFELSGKPVVAGLNRRQS